MLWKKRDWVDYLGERIYEERKDILTGYKIHEVYELQLDLLTKGLSDELTEVIENKYYKITSHKSVRDPDIILELEELVNWVIGLKEGINGNG